MKPFLLSPVSLNKMLQMAGNSVETLLYLESALREKINASQAKEAFLPLMQNITDLIENATFQEKNLTQLDPWSGARGLTDKLHAAFNSTKLSEFQDFIATKLLDKIPAESMTLDCVVGDKADFLRAYSKGDGNPLEGEELEAMDRLFNAWLAQPENKMLMQDGVIYRGTDEGEVLQDTSEDTVKARANKIRELLKDPVRGFERYVELKKPGAQVRIVQHEAPQEEIAPS